MTDAVSQKTQRKLIKEFLARHLKNATIIRGDMDIELPVREITPTPAECLLLGKTMPEAKEFEHTGIRIITIKLVLEATA